MCLERCDEATPWPPAQPWLGILLKRRSATRSSVASQNVREFTGSALNEERFCSSQSAARGIAPGPGVLPPNSGSWVSTALAAEKRQMQMLDVGFADFSRRLIPVTLGFQIRRRLYQPHLFIMIGRVFIEPVENTLV